MSRRVAITGIGAVSALGLGIPVHLAALREGRGGIGPLTLVPPEQVKTRVVGEVPGYAAEAHFNPRQISTIDRSGQFALLAAAEAMDAAAGATEGVSPQKAGVIFGAAVGCQTLEEGYVRILRDGARPLPFTVPRVMPSSAASQISMAYHITGPSFSTASACSSASHAIGLSFQMIRSGMLDMAVTGGCEAPLTLGMVKSWEALRVLAADTCRPFSKDRSGLVLGEGAAVLVLEEMERARARGATILGEVLGFGMTADGADLTAPDASSTARAISAALEDAGLDAGAVDYVAAHGTGTVLNDKTETTSLRTVLGDRLAKVPVSSLKSMTGHCFGASGALGVTAALLGMRNGFLPPTLNFREPDPECDVDCVPNAPRAASAEIALVNAFAFGGLNAVLAIRAA
ncbi:beta-ketoacyl-[acyl-carrier-protein] synthase family protein [Xanthobacter autotrophicus]|uniref:beta-ketoacyl-[acyl-carrier-protein] synthase family protein n=1 Tax=Xanthobacter autotrophicus TaxID=280 RepID=UPI001E49D7AA|nr:beta-ketoacyl-[acyl-carrier-protein] synthase family protein [Xanthobacter autotrophicus]UDQ89539.1 beta-ketoacyl-[acyl-carrier-protein] synthase family protein [Xanthobacter autotrophicus]